MSEGENGQIGQADTVQARTTVGTGKAVITLPAGSFLWHQALSKYSEKYFWRKTKTRESSFGSDKRQTPAQCYLGSAARITEGPAWGPEYIYML